MRQSITRLADGTKSFAQRVSILSEAEREMATSIPVVPTQIGRKKEYDGEYFMTVYFFGGLKELPTVGSD